MSSKDTVARKSDVSILRGDIEILKRDLTIRTGTMLAASIGLIIAIMKAL